MSAPCSMMNLFSFPEWLAQQWLTHSMTSTPQVLPLSVNHCSLELRPRAATPARKQLFVPYQAWISHMFLPRGWWLCWSHGHLGLVISQLNLLHNHPVQYLMVYCLNWFSLFCIFRRYVLVLIKTQAHPLSIKRKPKEALAPVSKTRPLSSVAYRSKIQYHFIYGIAGISQEKQV